MRPALLLLALAGCADRGPKYRPAGNASPRDGGMLRYATVSEVRTLDPTIENDDVSLVPVHALFDTLVDYDRDLHLVPRLAERWTISPDGLVYTFALRPNLHYSDGTPIVAGDIAYSLSRAQQDKDSPYVAFLGDVKTVDAPSERELAIHLAQPNAAFIYVLTMPFTTPQRRAYVAAQGDRLRRTPLATGPYMLASWDEGRMLVLRKNPQYWDPLRAHLDEIVLVENVARDVQLMMFERGELDTAERLTAPDQLWLSEMPAWQPYLHRRVLMNAYGSRMNTRRKPFDDRRVRQALNYALDKQHTIKLLDGAAIAAHGMLIPGVLGRDDSLAPYPHDPAKARALLAEAGYPDGLDVEYVLQADDEAERLAQSMQADLAAVGVRVRLARMSVATLGEALGRVDGPPFAKVGWIADSPDPSSFFDASFHSRALAGDYTTNWSFYANPALDQLLDDARREADPTQRAALYRHVERILYDDAPWLWDYHQMMTEVVQPYVAGYDPHPVWLRDYTSTWLDVGPDGPVPR